MSELNVSVVAVDRKVWVGAAKSIVATTPDGEIGIFAGHEPVLSLLVNGVVRIQTLEGEQVAVAVHGGFVAVDSDHVRVLAEIAELAGDIDVDRAKKALDRASREDSPESIAAVHRAETRLKAAAAATATGLHS